MCFTQVFLVCQRAVLVDPIRGLLPFVLSEEVAITKIRYPQSDGVVRLDSGRILLGENDVVYEQVLLPIPKWLIPDA